jgi:putative FmdB family regulatory protein
MPIYEYRRKDGSTFEVIQKFSDDPLSADPETGEPVERVYTAPAIHFKGSGFHNTDYGSSRRAKAGGADAQSGGTGDAGKPSSAESKASSGSSESGPSKSGAGDGGGSSAKSAAGTSTASSD